ncbi:protein obstructor-E-like [Chironomus tepperi]|uniref:protein obstructor-E-like n=1 Tax=Chironomus tepperi TaxID=113505 RepID=UPI00391EEA59
MDQIKQNFFIIGGFLLTTYFSSIKSLSLHQMTQSLKQTNICENIQFGLLPYEPDCSYFIICQNGYPRVERCPFDTTFDRHAFACTHGHNNQCDNKIDGPPNSPARCPEVDDINNPVFLPDLSDCRKYFVCSNGSKIERECVDGLLWNPEQEWCDIPENVPSCNSGDSINPPSTTERVHNCADWHRCPVVGQGYLPHLQNCQRYFECINGIRFLRSCPHGEIFDVNTMKCGDPVSSICAKHAVCSA